MDILETGAYAASKAIVDQHRNLGGLEDCTGELCIIPLIGGIIGGAIGGLVGIVSYFTVHGFALAAISAYASAGFFIGAIAAVVIFGLLALGYGIVKTGKWLLSKKGRNLRMLAAGSYFNEKFSKENLPEIASKIWLHRTGEDIEEKYFENPAAIFCNDESELSAYYLQPNPTSNSHFMLFSVAGVVNGYDYTDKIVTYKCSRNDNSDGSESFKECQGMFGLITKAIVPQYEMKIKSDGKEEACSYVKETFTEMLKKMEEQNQGHLIRNNPNLKPIDGMLKIKGTDEYEENTKEIVQLYQSLNSSIKKQGHKRQILF